MQVFRDAVEKNGGPLPLGYYLQSDVGSAPDPGPLLANKTIDLLKTRVDRRNFFECLLHDKDFPILNTFLVSGVPVNAVREEDGATALHIATAATLDLLDDSLMHVFGDGSRDKAAMSSTNISDRSNRGNQYSFLSPDVAELEEDLQRRTDRILNPPCPNQLILGFLIDNGADVNAPMRNQHRQTSLMVATARQNVKAAKLLLAKGADVYAQDAAGCTVLTYAARYPLLLELLRVWMGEENFFSGAVRERLLHTVCRGVGNRFAALYLVEQVRLDVNGRDGPIANTTTDTTGDIGVAEAASSYRCLPTAAVPASNGVNVVLHSTHGEAVRPTATTAGHASCVSAFDTNSINNAGGTAVEMVNLSTHRGDTPLHCAVSTGDVALVRALLSKGADVHAENSSGVTPLRLAQSQSHINVSMKQYWREAMLLLRPNSPGAMAARRRRCDLRHECNPAKVRALLTAFNNATPGPSQEKILQEETALYIWQVCTPMDYAQFAAVVFLPHVFYYLCCCLLRNFFLLLCVLPLLYGSYVGMQRRDSHRACSRPLTGLGWCSGYVVAQSMCLLFFTTRYYYQYYSFDLEEHAAVSWWLVPSAIATFALSAYLVLFSSPGVVTTTEGQRKGIYASLRNAKDNYQKELLYGIDLRTMVKKPVRAQYCVQMQRVVLRFDQYCTYLSTVVGGGNQRVFFWTHVSLLVLLSCFYHYAREYSRLMSSVAKVAQTVSGGGAGGGAADQAVFQKLAETPFGTAWHRFGYMYTQVILPIMILMDVYALYNQMCLIARNLTVYDLDHAEDESSVYCFNLGSTTYTLYDRGIWANVQEFLGWSSFTQIVYRVPHINPYLQKIVEDHQQWQLNGGDGCCDNHHGHNHGGGGSDNNTNVMFGGEKIGPAEYGDDESTRTQQMLEGKQRQAFAAAQSTAALRPHATRQSNKTANTVAAGKIEVSASAYSPTLHSAAANNSNMPQQKQGEQVNGGEDGEGEYCGDDEGDGADDGGTQASSVLAMQIFQQMVRTGSTDVGRGVEPNGSSNRAGASGVHNSKTIDSGSDAETQREWDAAVEQARQMFDFYRQSLGAQDKL